MAKSKQLSPLTHALGEIVSQNLTDIKLHLTRQKTNDHSNIDKFQKNICDALNTLYREFAWHIEAKPAGRRESDSIDIYGENDTEIWIIEIDAARADQVAKKFLSRAALKGINSKKPLNYVALLYPATQKQGKTECEKFVRYSNDILKMINKTSSVIGIYIDVDGTIELWDYNQLSIFSLETNGNTISCIAGMTQCAKEAIKQYIYSHNIKSFDKLKKIFGRYVNCQVGPSRYSPYDQRIVLGDDEVFVYTQWRENGVGTNWIHFVNLCDKLGIIIEKQIMKYKGGKFVC